MRVHVEPHALRVSVDCLTEYLNTINSTATATTESTPTALYTPLGGITTETGIIIGAAVVKIVLVVHHIAW